LHSARLVAAVTELGSFEEKRNGTFRETGTGTFCSEDYAKRASPRRFLHDAQLVQVQPVGRALGEWGVHTIL